MTEFRLARLHLHGRGLVIPSLILIAAAGVVGYSVRGARDGEPWIMYGYLAVAIGVVFGLLPIVGWQRYRVVITTHTTTLRHGLLGLKRRRIPHHRVSKVTMKQNAWQRVFGSGDVVLDAVDGQRLTMHDVPNVVTVADAMRELTGTFEHEQFGPALPEHGVSRPGAARMMPSMPQMPYLQPTGAIDGAALAADGRGPANRPPSGAGDEPFPHWR